MSIDQVQSQTQASHCCEVNHNEHDEFADKTKKWDRLGMTLSMLCAIHCVATPFLLLSLPFLGEFFENEWIHVGMALFVIPVGLYAFISGYKHHRQLSVVAAVLVGMSLIIAATFQHHDHSEVGHLDLMTLCGGIILVIAHVLNRRACLCHKHS